MNTRPKVPVVTLRKDWVFYHFCEESDEWYPVHITHDVPRYELMWWELQEDISGVSAGLPDFNFGNWPK